MFSLKIFTIFSWEHISWKWTCLIYIWITWFQKELAITQLQIPHIKFKEYNYNPTRKILVPFITTKVCYFALDLGKYSFVQTFLIYLQWSSGKVLNSYAGGQSSNPVSEIFCILTVTSLGAPVRSRAQASYLFLSSSWDYISPNDFGMN